jgi:hypothetical protein
LASAAAAALVALSACSSVKAVSDFDPEADFTAYRTYSWLDRGDAPEQAFNLPDHLDRRLQRVVADELRTKGIELAPVLPQADLLLVYYVGLESELRVTHTTSGYWYPYRYWPGAAYTDVRRYTEGTVVLDMIDRRTERLVWTGTVSSAVSSPNPPSDRIARVVARLLEAFPPR